MGLEPTTSDGLGLCSTTELNYPTSAAFRIAVYATPIFRDSAPGRTHEPHPLQYVPQRILFDPRFRVDRIRTNVAKFVWGDRRNQTEAFAFTARCAVTTPRSPFKIKQSQKFLTAADTFVSAACHRTRCGFSITHAGGNPKSSLCRSRTICEVAVCCNALLPCIKIWCLPSVSSGALRFFKPALSPDQLERQYLYLHLPSGSTLSVDSLFSRYGPRNPHPKRYRV